MKRRLAPRWLTPRAGLVMALAGGWMAAQFIPPRGGVPGRNPFRARVPGRPLVIAHAGGKGLAPENTLQAFAASVALGCDLLEADLRWSKEGELVTHHDATVDRTSNGTGAVCNLTLAELKALNFGHHFRDATGAQPYRESPARLATVQELFERFPQVPMILELKDRGELGRQAARHLAALIGQYDAAGRVCVASFDDATLAAFRQAMPHDGGAPPSMAARALEQNPRPAETAALRLMKSFTSLATGQTRRFVLLRLFGLSRLWSAGAVAAQWPADPREAGGFDLTRPGCVRALHARNMAVHYWTVNDPAEMRRLAKLGADGLITDYPDRLLAVLTASAP